MNRAVIEREAIRHGVRPLEPISEVEDEGLGFERLHALVRGGYVPQIGTEAVDSSIVLDHQGKGPRLRLFADGAIQVLDRRYPVHAEGDRFRIRADDEANYRRLALLVESKPRKRATRWLKRFFLLALVLTFWMFSVALTIAITAG